MIYDELSFSKDHSIVLDGISDWIPVIESEEDLDGELEETFAIGLYGGRTGNLATEIAQRWFDVQIMSCDQEVDYLEQARFNIEVAGVTPQVQLYHNTAEDFSVAEDQFDLVIGFYCLSSLENPGDFLAGMLRSLKKEGKLFVLDYCAPEQSDVGVVDSCVKALIESSGVDQALITDWMHRVLGQAKSLQQMREVIAGLGAGSENVKPVSACQWTWVENCVS